jgi:two-component system, NarL family, response regulator DevR
MRSALLVDRHPLWLDTIKAVVARADVRVAGTTSSSSEALELLDSLKPDLLVTGIHMPPGEINGIQLIRAARSRLPKVRAIVLSASTDQANVDAAFAAGARAYVIKTAHADDITAAVRQAFEHSIYFAPPRAVGRPAEIPPENSAALTRRELQILQLVAEGHSNAELARMLWVTEQTIKFHLSNIYRKLEVSNRTEAGRWAQRAGLLAPSSAPAAA